MAKSRGLGGSNFNPLKCNTIHVVWMKCNNFSEIRCHKLSLLSIPGREWLLVLILLWIYGVAPSKPCNSFCLRVPLLKSANSGTSVFRVWVIRALLCAHHLREREANLAPSCFQLLLSISGGNSTKYTECSRFRHFY